MAIASLIIRLKDQASQGLGRIGGALAGLAGKAKQAALGTSGLAGAITQGVLQANAITFAIGKASEAIGFLNGKFEEAKNLQLEQINAATTFAALTGQSSDQAARFIENLNDRLAKSAATLPGATQDYKQLALAVQDNVIEAFKDPSGVLNQKGFEDTLASMSESFGALTAASTRDIGNTSLGLSKALAGASVSELRQIAFFEQNPVILNELEKRLTSMGKELKDLNITERVKLIDEIGRKFITEDFKKQASESVDGLIQSFSSTLFDPSAGIFGIMRDLDPATDGVQSAFSSMNDALKELIGPDGVFFRLAGILEAAGIKLPDPMLALKNAIDFAVRGLRSLNEGLNYMRMFIEAGHSFFDAVLNLPSFFSSPQSPDQQAEASGLQKVLLNISPELVIATAGAVGTFALLNSGFLQAAASAGVMAFTVGGKTITALRFLGIDILLTAARLQTFSRAAYASSLASLRFIGTLPGRSLSLATAGMQRFTATSIAMMTALRGLTISSVLSFAGQAIMGFATAVKVAGITMLTSPLGIAIAAIVVGAALIYKFWQPLASFFSGFFSGLIAGLAPLKPAFDSLSQSLGSVFGPVLQFVGSLLSPLLGLFGSLLTPLKDSDGSWRRLGETLGKVVAGAIIGVINLVKSLIDITKMGIDAIDTLIDKGRNAPIVGGAFRAIFGEGDQQPAVNPSYSGHVGNAAGGFLGNLIDAARREIGGMPAGAQLMIANSTETILPQGMLGNLIRSVATPILSPVISPTVNPIFSPNINPTINPIVQPASVTATPTTSGGNTFNISFTINEAGNNAVEIADRVVAEIQRRFEGELDAMLV